MTECPYPGLAAFGPEREGWFFGRAALTAELIARVDQRSRTGGVQLVVGPAGAGKSSLLQAGLLPKLDRAALPGSDRWPKLVFRPTADPLWVLAAQIALLTGADVVALMADPAQWLPRLSDALRHDVGHDDPHARVVLVVDQFEELFTLCTDDQQRRRFIEVLIEMAGSHDGQEPVGLVVAGVRTDFHTACTGYPGLRGIPLVVGPMRDHELRDAIRSPAQAVELDVEPELVTLLLRDMRAPATISADGATSYAAGRLPLLAHALRAICQQSHGATLTVQGYQDTGGIQHTIAATADQIYARLDDRGRSLAQSLFLRLIRIGDGTEDTRRRVPHAELVDTSPDPRTTAVVVNVFTQARLLTQHQATVEITHEAVLHNWPLLRTWIDTDRARSAARHQQVASPGEEDVGTENLRQSAVASGNAHVYQAAGDQNIVGRDLHQHFSTGDRRAVAIGGSASNVCPYPGLTAFGPAQAAWFFGRDRQLADLVTKLDERERRMVAGPVIVVASSGAGKSSLLRAGLVARLSLGALPGSTSWPRVVITPTSRPTQSLVGWLASIVPSAWWGTNQDLAVADLRRALAPGTTSGRPRRVVIIVDQFEELFTLCEQEADRVAFLNLLAELTSAASPDGPVALVVLGVRADFYGSCASYAWLRAGMQNGQVVLGPMTTGELRAAIVCPAEAVGLGIEPDLPERILRDFDTVKDGGADNSQLPLLAHALRGAWTQRYGTTMTVRGYEQTGGIAQAVKNTAEGAFARLSREGQVAAESVFLRLVSVGRHRDDARRRVRTDLLTGAAPEAAAARAVVEEFTRARLLTQDAETTAITHEALLWAWPRLAAWMNNDRDGNILRQEVLAAAVAWDQDGRGKDMLYRGTKLAAAMNASQRARAAKIEPTVMTDFLAASARQAGRALRVRRALMASLTALAVLAGGASWVALGQRSAAIDESNQAVFNQVSAEADQLRVTDPSLAAQLDLVADRMKPTPDGFTHLVTDATGPLSTTLAGAGGNVNAVAFLTGSRLAAAEPGTIQIWDLAGTPHVLKSLLSGSGSTFTALAAGRDGTILASATNPGGIQLWNTSKPGAPVPVSQQPSSGEDFSYLTFNSNGTLLAGLDATHGTVRLWNVSASGQINSYGTIAASDESFFSVAFDSANNRLATGATDGTIRMWDVGVNGSPQPVAKLSARADGLPVSALTFYDNGAGLAAGSYNGGLRLWNSGLTGFVSLVGHTDRVVALAFDRQLGRLASGSYDGTVRVWDLLADTLIQTLVGHTGVVALVGYSPDGSALASGSWDGSARVWTFGPGRVLKVGTNTVSAVASSRAGHMFAVGSYDGSVTVLHGFPVQSSTVMIHTTSTTAAGEVFCVAISPDGKTLAAGGDGGVDLWNIGAASNPPPLLASIPGKNRVLTVAFSPDGKDLAYGGFDNKIGLWNVAEGKSIDAGAVSSASIGVIYSVVFGSTLGGKTILASGGSDGTIRLWDLSDGNQIGQPLRGHLAIVAAVAFSHDGTTLASASYDNTIRLWNVADPARAYAEGKPLTGHVGTVPTLAFSPDGRTLISGGSDFTARLWNVAEPSNAHAEGKPLVGHAGIVDATTFDSTGTIVVTGSWDGTVRFWDLNLDDVRQRICAVTKADLSSDLWKIYIPQVPFDPPCH